MHATNISGNNVSAKPFHGCWQSFSRRVSAPVPNHRGLFLCADDLYGSAPDSSEAAIETRKITALRQFEYDAAQGRGAAALH